MRLLITVSCEFLVFGRVWAWLEVWQCDEHKTFMNANHIFSCRQACANIMLRNENSQNVCWQIIIDPFKVRILLSQCPLIWNAFANNRIYVHLCACCIEELLCNVRITKLWKYTGNWQFVQHGAFMQLLKKGSFNINPFHHRQVSDYKRCFVSSIF